MWRLLYETTHSIIQRYWKYAHHYAVQHSHTNNEYYTWDKFVEETSHPLILVVRIGRRRLDFDPRFYYYSKSSKLGRGVVNRKG